MEETVKLIEQGVEFVGLALDLFAVFVIVGGLIWSIWKFLQRERHHPTIDHYYPFKKRIGRFFILGLEIIVAADIVKTVALEPTFQNVGVLALLVLVRTFLSWTLTVEIEGRWPWQPRSEAEDIDLSK